MRAAMADRVFIDTNLLVYSVHRGDEPQKTARAIEMLTTLRLAGNGYISPQIIAEFVSVACRKLIDTLSRPQALRAASLFAEQFVLLPLDDTTVREALRASERYSLDCFDAQVWATARLGGCRVILTEDLHGVEIEGVAYVDPFASDFDPASPSLPYR
jgi:predicted nucleic acid-binding protein